MDCLGLIVLLREAKGEDYKWAHRLAVWAYDLGRGGPKFKSPQGPVGM